MATRWTDVREKRRDRLFILAESRYNTAVVVIVLGASKVCQKVLGI